MAGSPSALSKVLFPIFVGIAIGVLLMRGGLPMLVSIVRFVWPAVVLYVVYRGVLGWWRKKYPKVDAAGKPVIEICPKCGHEKGAWVHVCRPGR